MLAFKLLYPDHMHLTRGNHETKNMNATYGFEGEVKAKYGATAYEMFTEVFNALPLGIVIKNKVFVVHGGLFSDEDVTLAELRKINRFKQPPDAGHMCEVMWSDPQNEEGRSISKRGVAIQFGPDVTERFLKRNNLELLVRSHEVKDEGYEVQEGGKCITIFSAPNYCDRMGNKGAFIKFKADLKPDFHQFEAVPHPPVPVMAYASGMGRMLGM